MNPLNEKKECTKLAKQTWKSDWFETHQSNNRLIEIKFYGKWGTVEARCWFTFLHMCTQTNMHTNTFSHSRTVAHVHSVVQTRNIFTAFWNRIELFIHHFFIHTGCQVARENVREYRCVGLKLLKSGDKQSALSRIRLWSRRPNKVAKWESVRGDLFRCDYTSLSDVVSIRSSVGLSVSP